MNIPDLTYTFLLSLLTITLSLAQRPDGMMRLTPEQRVEMSNSKMDSVAVLTQDQKTAINFLHEELYLKDVPERGAFRNMSTEEREAFMQKRREKMEAYREGLQAILTEEQLQKWKDFEDSRRNSPRQRRNESRGRSNREQ